MVRSLRIRVAGQFVTVFFVLAVPLLLITNSVTWAVNDLRLYRYGYDKYVDSTKTGMDKDSFSDAARQIRGYFNSTHEPIDTRAQVFGEERELFSQREVLHMRDVKVLIWGVYGVDVAAAVYILVFAGIGFFIRGRLLAPTLFKYLLWGSGLTVGLVALVGVVSLVGFDSLFQYFHQVSFSNDFWKLDPQRDYLVMMFPQGFWLDATLFVALATVGQALAISGILGVFMAIRRRRIRNRQEPLLQVPSNATEP